MLTATFPSFVHSPRTECKANGSVTARKVQKADRERVRRDKLNVQFQELGTTLGMMQLLSHAENFLVATCSPLSHFLCSGCFCGSYILSGKSQIPLKKEHVLNSK